ncbi:unnamed protein product [Adineta steineri]|uniref:Uncharacterized protein n=1 Tax=Adineta steineri TaxID=433720 RepID=A0A816G7T6_9BILA|nr:unnamed protein product [Adineta steineri]CAF1670689.1 unnamed protein product [Adineta steineri]
MVFAGGSDQGNKFNQLNEPRNIFIDKDCSLYVSDEKNHRVMKWKKDAKVGEIVVGGNGFGTQSNQLNSPIGLSFNNEENLYVVNNGNDRIEKYEKI